MDRGSNILVLSEHWLWPYELHKLGEIHDDFEAFGNADSRLTEKADSKRGFGGVGILWHRSIGATVISGCQLERICGIRFTIDDGTDLLCQ